MTTRAADVQRARDGLRQSRNRLGSLLGPVRGRRHAPLLFVLTALTPAVLLLYGLAVLWASLGVFVGDTSLRMLPDSGPTAVLRRTRPAEWSPGDRLYIEAPGRPAELITYTDGQTHGPNDAPLARIAEGTVTHTLPARRTLRAVTVGMMILTLCVWLGTAPQTPKDGIIQRSDKKETNH